MKKTSRSKSGGRPKRESTKTRAVAFRTNASNAAYGRVLERIPKTNRRIKSAATKGRPQNTWKRKSVMIWSGLRVAKVCRKMSDAVPAIRLGKESNRKTTYHNPFMFMADLREIDNQVSLDAHSEHKILLRVCCRTGACSERSRVDALSRHPKIRTIISIENRLWASDAETVSSSVSALGNASRLDLAQARGSASDQGKAAREAVSKCG